MSDPESYLKVPREWPYLQLGVEQYWANFNALTDSGIPPAVVDLDTGLQATIDSAIMSKIAGLDGTLSEDFAVDARTLQTISSWETSQKLFFDSIHSNTQGSRFDEAVDSVISAGLTRVRSRHKQTYDSLGIEHWLHTGPTYAFLPVINELLAPGQPPNGPSESAIVRSLLGLATISNVLRAVRSVYIESAPITDGQRDFVDMGLGGLLLEYDALAYLTMGSHNTWVLPAQPSLDRGLATEDKSDIVCYDFSQPAGSQATYYSVKAKPPARGKSHHATRQTPDGEWRTIYAKDFHCTDTEGSWTPGVICDALLAKWAKKTPKLRDPRFKFTLAFATLLENLPIR